MTLLITRGPQLVVHLFSSLFFSHPLPLILPPPPPPTPNIKCPPPPPLASYHIRVYGGEYFTLGGLGGGGGGGWP